MNSKFKSVIKKILIVAVGAVLIFAAAVAVILKMTVFKSFPVAEGDIEMGKWYRIPVEGAKSSDGSRWHGIFRKGSENKVVVYFFGGGVSITPYTSEKGNEFFATTAAVQDFVAMGGIGSDYEENPFKDYSFIVVPYATGDFHCGTGVYQGENKTVYHTGYNNYSAFMDKVKEYVGQPDTLLITGFSAGGFATSLLADDVISRFPSAENITVCVDSALLLYDDWNKTRRELWQAPEEISQRLVSDNLVLDSLTALHQKRGDSVKILFDCSYRDDTLLQYQSYIQTGKMDKTKALGDNFQRDLTEMVKNLQENIPGIGIYIWSYNQNSETGNTQHTIISSNFFEKLEENTSVCDWVCRRVQGDVRSYGLHLLGL